MALFISRRRQFLARFEPHGTGFLYRRSVRSDAVHVTAEERSSLICDHEKWDGVSWIVYPVALATAVTVALACTRLARLHSWGPAAFWLTFLLILVVAATVRESSGKALLLGKKRIDRGLSKDEVNRRETSDTPWGPCLLDLVIALIWACGAIFSPVMGLGWRLSILAVAVPTVLLILKRGHETYRRERQPAPGESGR